MGQQLSDTYERQEHDAGQGKPAGTGMFPTGPASPSAVF